MSNLSCIPFGTYGSISAQTFSMSGLFNLRTTAFNVQLVWNTESKKSDTIPNYKSMNAERLVKMRPAVVLVYPPSPGRCCGSHRAPWRTRANE